MAEITPSLLSGKNIVVTRAAEQSDALMRELEARGARAILYPVVAFGPPEDFAPLDKALRGLASFDWLLLTSQNAVRALLDRANSLGLSLAATAESLEIAAVGPATAGVAAKAGLRMAHVASKHRGTALAEELGVTLAGKHVFLPRSDRANPDLPEALRRTGARVTEVVAYRTLALPETNSAASCLEDSQPHAILFFSPSAVRSFLEQERDGEPLRSITDLSQRIPMVAIGPVTAAALGEAGVSQIVQAADTTVSAVIGSLEEFFANTEQRASAGAKRG